MERYFSFSSAFRGVYFSQFHILTISHFHHILFAVSYLPPPFRTKAYEMPNSHFSRHPLHRPFSTTSAPKWGERKTFQLAPNGHFLLPFHPLHTPKPPLPRPCLSPFKPPFFQTPKNHLCIFAWSPMQNECSPPTFPHHPLSFSIIPPYRIQVFFWLSEKIPLRNERI